MNILLNFLLITMVIYLGLLLWLIIGNVFSNKKNTISEFPPVSIIVAIRNGENSLPNLIRDLEALDYNGELEFIMVDDESSDSTAHIIQKISEKDKRFIYVISAIGNASLHLKKRALDAGISTAQNEWLLFTDVDCRVQKGWVTGMASYFSSRNDYVIGHSNIKSGNTLLNIFQSLDYSLLLIAARGAANLRHPVACTGQNQAYRKSLYQKVGGFSRIKNQMQGDDSLFLNLCRKWGKAVVVFADDFQSHVSARQEKTWIPLLNQRLRWSGDANIMWKVNVCFYLLIVGFFLLHLTLVSLFCISIFHPYYVMILVKFLIIKFILEFLLYFSGIRQLDQSLHFIEFILWFFIHIPYVVLMGLGSFFAEKLSWRGRKLRLSS